MATRLERVVLELEDQFTPVAARQAAATAVLKRELSSLSTQAVRTSRDTDRSEASIGRMGNTAGGSSREIDRFSGRIRLLLDLIAIIGPTAAPIGAVAIPVVTGLASALGMAALAGGTAVIAFQGVGDALGKLNEARLDPTIANLEAADEALRRLGPDARSLVGYLSSLTDEWHELRDAAAGGLLPGVESAIDSLLERGPQATRILTKIADTTGDMLAEGADSLASDRWDDFFDFIEHEAPPAIAGLARATGDLAHAGAELWVAFGPLNSDFLTWLINGADAIDRWATGLDQTEGFQEFVAYVRENGPQVADTLGSIFMALLNIVEATAPLGGPVLQVLEAVADVVSTIADSPFGPPIMAGVTALALLNRGLAVTESLGRRAWVQNIRGAETFAGKVRVSTPIIGKGTAALAGLALAGSGVADKFELGNTMSLALMGTIAGPWGAAVGGAVGLLLDLNKSTELNIVSSGDLTDKINEQTGALNQQGYTAVAEALAEYSDAAALAGLSLADITKAAAEGGPALANAQAAIDAYISSFGTVWERADAADRVAELSLALNGQNEEVNKATDAARTRAAAQDAAAAADDRATTAVERFAEAVARANRMLAQRATVRDYQAAVDDFTKAVNENWKAWKRNGAQRDADAPRWRAMEAALDDIAGSALKVAENLKGAERTSFLRQARQDFVDAAQKLGFTREEAIKLANQLGLVGRIKAKPEVDVETASALRKLDAVRTGIAQLHDKTITITTRAIHIETRLERSGGTGGGSGGSQPFTAFGAPLVTAGGTPPASTDRDARQQLRAAVAGSFNTGLFGTGLAGLDRALSGDVANIAAMRKILNQLRAAGLDTSGRRGALYRELAASGDLATAQQLLASGPSGIDYYESLFAQRARDQQAFANQQVHHAFAPTGGPIFGLTAGLSDDNRKLRQEIQGLRRDLQGVVPRKVGDAVVDGLNEVAGKVGRR